MKIDVYDTYARDNEGKKIHFDVLVESKTTKDQAYQYALEFIKSIGSNNISLEQNMCNFCHSELSDDHTTEEIKQKGYSILQMEGCPNPLG